MATYLITQATGKQSQYITEHILAAGAKIHAVVRNPDKLPEVLQRPGVKIFKGESTDFEAVFQAAQGCKGAFLNTFPIPGLEAQQAKTIAEACKKAGVETVVASTSFLTGDKEIWDDKESEEIGIRSYYQSKHEVEEVVRNAGFKFYTIIRPGFIHFDFLLPNVYGNFPALPAKGELDHAYNDAATMIYTDANDIGKYATAAFQNPEKFNGQAIQVGKSNLTLEETRKILTNITGREVTSRRRTPEEVEAAKAAVPAQKFNLWANIRDFSSAAAEAKDVEAKFGIAFTTLEEALQREKARLLECIPA
ncbi:hypothetical protein CEP51_005798 [Fusarium floridanum]|uniref:NmrA-like domain-containing protein n=1 Tax=Fusarium floridanum TaxID=1325733 RepID=A0A428RVH7_9HYPO|nr:hypothetical protein CEP51_005798 [Fusarium floridanum]